MFARKIYYVPADVFGRLTGKRKGLLPPTRMLVTIGGGDDFLKIGEEFLDLFVRLGNLKPSDAVLDVGCGVGRMALALTHYLEGSGRFEGFDVTPEEIRWCQRNITPRFPKFRFQVANVFNTMYNPTSTITAKEFRFPFDDGAFDFVYLTSVFTHMLPGDLENYLAEISRVLKKGGRCLTTYFLLNQESERLLHSKASSLDFQFDFGTHRTISKEKPEHAIAYPEETVKNLYAKYRFSIESPIHYGSWCGRKEYTSYQDIVVARKE